jgi:polyhydroxyalkanoate synthesis repressor PhaR
LRNTKSAPYFADKSGKNSGLCLHCTAGRESLCCAAVLRLRKDKIVADSEGVHGEEAASADAGLVTIKKYANRRLYNTRTSSYVTLDHLSEMVRAGVDFIVLDAKTGEDITRSVLTQIIFEQESRGQNLLPVQFLRRLIRFYGDQMQGFLPPYLEMSMESFAKSQDQMRENFSRTFGGRTPVTAFEDLARQNMALFQQALSMWAPFTPPSASTATDRPAAPAATEEASEEHLDTLRRQVEAMQKQLDALATPRKPGE